MVPIFFYPAVRAGKNLEVGRGLPKVFHKRAGLTGVACHERPARVIECGSRAVPNLAALTYAVLELTDLLQISLTLPLKETP